MLLLLLFTHLRADTTSCLRLVCTDELAACTRTGDCAVLFNCVGAGDCAQKFPPDTPVGKCLTRCSQSITDEADDTKNFRHFWETRNAAAEKHLQSFKPSNLEFFFPEVRSDTSGPALRRRLLKNTKVRLLKLVDQLAATEDFGDEISLLETDKSTFSGFRELRDKIERDVENLLKRDI